MTTYSYGQLEGLWIAAGGSAATAPLAAALAEAESGGNPLAAYPGTTVAPGQGSTTDATGLWQILGLPAGNFTAAELTDPLENAKMAVAKYQQAGNSFSPWQTYDDGTYSVQNGVAPIPWTGGGGTGSGGGGGSGGGSGGGGSGSGGGSTAPPVADPTTLSANSPDFLNVLSVIPGLSAVASAIGSGWDGTNLITRDIAVVLDRAFGMFKPGQGFRTVAFVVAILAGLGAFKTFATDDERGSKLPLTLGLTGVMAMAMFMSFRPWPVVGDMPIKPGAYAEDIATGQVPPQGPPATSPDEVDAIQAGLDLMLGVWVTTKIAQGIASVATAADETKQTIFGWWGNLF